MAQSVVRPPLAGRRLDRYEGARGTYHYRAHRPERGEHETVDGATFSGRLVQPIVPKGGKHIRYYGGHAPKTFAKIKVLMHEALAKVEGVGKGAVQRIARLTYRQRYAQSPG